MYLMIFIVASISKEVAAQHGVSTGTLSDVSFVQGSWKATSGDKIVEAVWSAPLGDNMVGFVRILKDNKADLYELFAFEQTSDGLIVSVKHFRPNLIGMEEKEDADRYHFIEADAGRAVFKKLGDEVRVLYEKRSDDEFVIALGTPSNGSWQYKDFWEFSKND